MKKIFSTIFSIALVAGLSLIAVPGIAQVWAQEEPSTYAFDYDLPEAIVVEADVDINLTFATDVLGTKGYEGVRFAFTTTGPGDVTFKATDSEAVEHTFTNEGYWGSADGFSLPADYSATTTWTLNFSAVGDYNITFSLIDAATEEVVAEITGSVDVYVQPNSTYSFDYTVPDDIMVNTNVEVDVTFATDILGTEGYEGVRFAFNATGPGAVTFKATDSELVEHTFTSEGYWGPSSGFALPADYSATTTWTLNFSQAGEYTITFSLIDAATEEIVADTIDSVTITIQAISAAINIDPDTLNLRSNGRWITAYIELPGHYSAEDINLEAIRLQYEGESLAAEWGDLQDGVLMVKFNRAAITGWFDGLHDIEVSLTLTGEVNGFQFEGSDTIRVINPPVREQSQSSNFGPPDDIPGNNANNVTGPPEKDMPDRGNSSNAIPDHANGRR